jgi:hypothetical protein
MTVSKLLKCTILFKFCEVGERLNGNVSSLAGGEEIREFIIGGSATLLFFHGSNGILTGKGKLENP